MSTLPKHCTLFFLLIFFLSQYIPVTAQEVSRNDTLPPVSITHSYGIKWTSLRMGGGLGVADYRDMGTAPVTFKGFLMQPTLGLEFGGTRKWKVTVDMFTTAGIFEDVLQPRFNFGSFDISNTLRLKFQHFLAQPHETTILSWGLGGSSFLDVTVNPEYENATAGVSYFAGPEIMMRADIDLSLTDYAFHVELGCMPLAAVMRPGYSYIDNYTSTHPVSKSIFDNYEWLLKPLAGLYSEIAFNILKLPYCHMSLSYRWEYHTTGKKGSWRFDHALHLLELDFYYTLKQRSVCRTTVSRL